MIGMKVVVWVAAVSLALALLLGVGYCNERERRQRDAHDATADSLARNTQDATADLTSYVDTVYLPARARLTSALGRVDTLTLPPEGREAVRECRSFVLTCEGRAARSDSVVRDLRRELEHAKNPPPGPRLSWEIRGGRDWLGKEWEAAGGPRYRIVGPVEAYAELGARPYTDSTGVRRNEARIVTGLQLTFGRKRQ